MNAINRIILVGNGFDLAHGLATRYADFINWYWEKYLNHLRMCHNRTYSDHLCTFILNDNHNTWSALLWSILNPIKLPSGQEFYEHIKSDEKNFTIHYSAFMKRICQSIELKGWVDIENEYYTALNEEYFETPEKINEEFEIVKSNLIEYLSYIQKKDITTSIIEHKLQEKILFPIMISEVAISARRQLIDFIQARSTLDEQHLMIEFRIVRKEHIDKDGNYNNNHIIPFWSLSSGERQVAYVISNFVYHLVNINSVHTIKDKKVAGLPLLKYKYVNVVFDEIELYFHPDLQRRFLSLIISALRNIHIEHIEGVNILMVTHSPFVLSDIPRSNVLVLSKQGEICGETFCANIHEMLGQNFFMEYTMGQIAQEEIEEIFSKYNNNSPISKKEWARYMYVSSIVGDDYLRSTLKRVMKKLEQQLNGRNE